MRASAQNAIKDALEAVRDEIRGLRSDVQGLRIAMVERHNDSGKRFKTLEDESHRIDRAVIDLRRRVGGGIR